jgi:CIC family chloride channel protein
VIALGLPQIMGVGYEVTDDVLRGTVVFWLLILLALAKILATAITLGGGGIGGVFSPSLFIGAMTGAAFGAVATLVAPDLASSQSTYALVGMGAVAGAVLGAPLSTILIMVELTGDLAFSIAVMVAVVLATVIYRRIQGFSFFYRSPGATGRPLGGRPRHRPSTRTESQRSGGVGCCLGSA